MSSSEQGATAHAPTNGDTVSGTNGQTSAESAPVNAQVESTSTATPIDLELPTSAADGLIQKPFAKPLDTAKPAAPAELTPEQQSKYEAVLKSASSWTTVATKAGKDAPTSPITEDEKMWLSRECLLRYLRATKWNVSEAETRLQSTLTWRREYDLKKLTPEYISIENETGKQVILGYDNNGRPCLYLLPSNQNTEKSDRQLEHLVFMLERAIDYGTWPGDSCPNCQLQRDKVWPERKHRSGQADARLLAKPLPRETWSVSGDQRLVMPCFKQ